MNCKHLDGWVLKEEIVINPDPLKSNDNIEAEFECNTIGCNKRKKFKFDIILIEEVKK